MASRDAESNECMRKRLHVRLHADRMGIKGEIKGEIQGERLPDGASPPPPLDRIEPSASISSMKRTHGARRAASSKRVRTWRGGGVGWGGVGSLPRNHADSAGQRRERVGARGGGEAPAGGWGWRVGVEGGG